jgi:Arc/MetJ-type ribon-helix-helix transcriptional regulator
MSKIQWEYDRVERPFCEQLKAMGWQWIKGVGWARLTQIGATRRAGLKPVLPDAAGGITFCLMTTVSLKLPESLLREIEQEAAARGVPKSAVIRDSLEYTLHNRRRAKKKASCLDLMGEWVGQVKGPPDASTNPRYLTEAILADHHRGKKKSR